VYKVGDKVRFHFGRSELGEGHFQGVGEIIELPRPTVPYYEVNVNEGLNEGIWFVLPSEILSTYEPQRVDAGPGTL